MTHRVSTIWRALRTGAAFAVFGAGSLLLALVVIPLSRLASASQARDLRAQRLIHTGFRCFRWYMVRTGLMTVSETGTERLRRGGPLLVVANHPTLLDAVILGSILPQVDCIVGAAHADNPAMRRTAALAGYIRNDGGAAVVEECARRLRAGRSVLVFPEGTRSPRRGLRPFRRGAAHVALATGSELLPVVLSCEPPTLMKGQPWYDVPDRPFHIDVRVEEPVSPKPYLDSSEPTPILARRLTSELRETFIKRMERG
jgi:1-acyl-sn-glycerol-3-phosphate acyltransferase